MNNPMTLNPNLSGDGCIWNQGSERVMKLGRIGTVVGFGLLRCV